MFAFLGAKGGVGTTTVATNVATALSQLADGSTILIDLHLAYGDAAVYLGTEPRFSVIDALENVHRLDKAFLGGLVGHARGGLSLLASSDRASATPVDSTSVRTLIESAARHYRYVVLDVPRSDVMIDALEPSSRHRDRRESGAGDGARGDAAVGGAAPALRQGTPVGRRQPVRHRSRRLARATSNACSARRSRTRFPSNYRIALEALNAGRPVVLDNHNKLAAALTGFARGLVETDEEPSPGKRQTGLLRPSDRSAIVKVDGSRGVKTCLCKER